VFQQASLAALNKHMLLSLSPANIFGVSPLTTLSSPCTLQEYGQFSNDSFMPHIFDPAYADCHVYVQGDYLDKLTPLDSTEEADQQRVVDHYVRGKARDNSRMGYYIKLSPQLNGMTVALGDVELWETQ
jgi:hypothetical protein